MTIQPILTVIILQTDHFKHLLQFKRVKKDDRETNKTYV